MNQRQIHQWQVAFGQVLRKHRQQAQLSQEKLAALAGVHRNYIGDVERAEENISLVKILRICSALSISPSCLIHEAQEDFEKSPGKS